MHKDCQYIGLQHNAENNLIPASAPHCTHTHTASTAPSDGSEMEQTEQEGNQMFGLVAVLRCFARCQHRGPEQSQTSISRAPKPQQSSHQCTKTLSVLRSPGGLSGLPRDLCQGCYLGSSGVLTG